MVERFGGNESFEQNGESVPRNRFNRLVDAQGRLVSIEYPNGDSIEFQYNGDGNVKSITDTISGTQIMRGLDQTWSIVHRNGSITRIDGTVAVDQRTGAVCAHLNNGTRVTTHPNGSVTVSNDRGGKSHG